MVLCARMNCRRKQLQQCSPRGNKSEKDRDHELEILKCFHNASTNLATTEPSTVDASSQNWTEHREANSYVFSQGQHVHVKAHKGGDTNSYFNIVQMVNSSSVSISIANDSLGLTIMTLVYPSSDLVHKAFWANIIAWPFQIYGFLQQQTGPNKISRHSNIAVKYSYG